MIQESKATVYHGGGRRWLTLQAAANAEARSKISERCECESIDHGAMDIEHITCWYHEPENYPVILRRLSWLYLAEFKQRRDRRLYPTFSQ